MDQKFNFVRDNALKAIEQDFSLALKRKELLYMDGTFSQILFSWSIGLFDDQEKERLKKRYYEIEDMLFKYEND